MEGILASIARTTPKESVVAGALSMRRLGVHHCAGCRAWIFFASYWTAVSWAVPGVCVAAVRRLRSGSWSAFSGMFFLGHDVGGHVLQ